MNEIDFINWIHKSDEQERSMAYKQASDILDTLKNEGIQEYDTEELIHFCIFRTCLIDFKITKLLTLILEEQRNEKNLFHRNNKHCIKRVCYQGNGS